MTPAVREVTVAVVAVPATVFVRPPGEAMTVYPATVAPFGSEAAQVSVAALSPDVADAFVGGDGRPAGTTGLEADDSGLVPMPLVAWTVNV